MHRLAVFVVLCAAAAAAACSPSAHSPVVEPAAAPAPAVELVRTGHAAVNLTGAWENGSENEPTVREIVLHPECNYSPAFWDIEQSGDTIYAWTNSASHAQGIAKPPAARVPPAEGWVSGVNVTLGTPGARYLLRYDSTTGHLRGTFNGAPFWAVRLRIMQPGGCIPVP